MDKIIVKGARVNNLKNIDIEIPKNKLVVMTWKREGRRYKIEIGD